jgi:prepilin-type N-terminal cleavage/methylation domain-containing protein
MRAARRDDAGFSLIEVIIVLAITLILAEIVYKVVRSAGLLYQMQTHAAERGFSSLRSIDDMSVEIARAGFGLGRDAEPVFPGRRDGVRADDAITLRSNPGGVAAALGKDLTERDQLVPVDGANQFVQGEEVLLADGEGTVERAEVTRATPDSLALRSLDAPDGQLQHDFLVALGARVLKVREVAFFLKTDHGTVVLARKATGQAEQILARYVGGLAFAYFDEAGEPMAPIGIQPGHVPGSVRITLSLQPNPDLPPVSVPALGRRVFLEPQSATVPFDVLGYHTIGVAAVIGQDPASAEKKVRLHAWPRPIPLF